MGEFKRSTQLRGEPLEWCHHREHCAMSVSEIDDLAGCGELFDRLAKAGREASQIRCGDVEPRAM